MKNFLLVLFIATASLLQAQNIKIEDTIINGTKFLVHPYKVSLGINSDQRDAYQIPPVLDSLPTGDYVLLKRKKKKYAVIAQFSIAEGKFNQSITFWDSKKKTLEEGNYLLGVKHGVWKTYNPKGKIQYHREYKNGKLNGVSMDFRNGVLVDSGLYVNGEQEGLWVGRFDNGKIYKIEHYKKGILHGPYRSYGLDKGENFFSYDLRFEGNYENGFLVGPIKIYEYSIETKRPYLFCELLSNDNAETAYSWRNREMHIANFINYYKCYYPNGKLKLEAYSDTIIKLSAAYKHCVLGEELSIWNTATPFTLPINHSFTLYYDNGKIKGRKLKLVFPTFENDDRFVTREGCDDVFNYDTLFYNSGKIEVVKIKLSDTLDRKRMLLTYFDLQNQLRERIFYIVDYSGEYQNYLNQNYDQGGWYSYIIDNKWLRPMPYSFPKEDSIYLQRKDTRDSITITTFYCPQQPTLEFKREYKKDKVLSDFKILKFGNPFVYTKSYENNGFKMISFCYIDTTRKESLNNVSSVFNLAENLSGFRSGFFQADSIFIYKNDQLFTGRLTFKNGTKSSAVKMKKNEIAITESFDYGHRHAFDVKFEVVKGVISTLKQTSYYSGAEEQSTVHYKNHLQEGDQLTVVKSKRRITGKVITPCSKGKVNGLSQSWKYENKKWNLTFKANYVNGELVDTMYYYFPNGRIETKSTNTNTEGVYIKYYNNGVIEKCLHYKNGTMDGLYFCLTPQGDTMERKIYKNGDLNGACLLNTQGVAQYVFHEGQNQYVLRGYRKDIVSTGFFKEGKLEFFDFKDEFKVRRFTIKVDSIYNGHQYFYEHDKYIYTVNDWDNFIVMGDVEIFYPNGRLYAKGKLTGKSIHNNRDEIYTGNEKTGGWQYYNPQGLKVAEVLYKKEILTFPARDSVPTIGEYKEFYPNGSIKYIGKLLSEETKNECNSDLHEVDFQVRYQYYFSATGDTLIKNGKGKLQLYESDGTLKAEVEMLNGEYNGWWKAYNKEGKLQTVGKYINGKKEGRWLYGDLTGINYLDDHCFESEEIKKQTQEAQKFAIRIEEVNFENDKSISNYTFVFTRSE